MGILYAPGQSLTSKASLRQRFSMRLDRGYPVVRASGGGCPPCGRGRTRAQGFLDRSPAIRVLLLTLRMAELAAPRPTGDSMRDKTAGLNGQFPIAYVSVKGGASYGRASGLVAAGGVAPKTGLSGPHAR